MNIDIIFPLLKKMREKDYINKINLTPKKECCVYKLPDLRPLSHHLLCCSSVKESGSSCRNDL